MQIWVASFIHDKPDSRYFAELDIDQPKVSKSLSVTVAKVVREEPAWTLLDEQRLAFNTIMDIAKNSDGEKHLVIVTGGPGTGKSVIAMQAFGELHTRYISRYSLFFLATAKAKGQFCFGSADRVRLLAANSVDSVSI